MTALLSVEGLTKQFGGHRAVDGVDLQVAEGELVCILGPNGAGKTTLFNLLTKDLQPNAGSIRFEGRDVTALPPHRLARLGIGRSYQITSVFPDLSVEDNVWVAAYRQDHAGRLVFWRRADRFRRDEARALELLERVGIAKLRHVQAGQLSYGDQRLLEIAITLAAAPRLLLLDEPTSGLSQEETGRVGQLIQSLALSYTVVMIEHKMDVVMRISSRLVVMDRGRVIADGSPETVARDPAVKTAYFGAEAARMLELQDVHTYYGNSHVLHGVSLRVGEGEVVALLGRNGAGKTTTLRSIMRLTPPRAGSVSFRGRSLDRMPTHRIARAGISYVPEHRDPFTLLTVRENLLLTANPASRWKMADVLGWFPALDELMGRKGGQLSGGQQQMMVIGRGLMTGPELLLLDEPSQGLAPVIVTAVLEMLRDLKRQRLSVLLVEQSIRVALELADRVYVLNNGRVVLEGDAAELRQDPARVERYVGVSEG